MGERESRVGPIARRKPEQRAQTRGLSQPPVGRDDGFGIARRAGREQKLLGPVRAGHPRSDAGTIVSEHLAQRARTSGQRCMLTGLQDPDPLEKRNAIPYREHRIERVVADDQSSTLGKVQHERKLFALHTRVDGHEDRSRNRRSHHRLDEGGMVPHHDAELRIVDRTCLDQRRSDAVSPVP